MMFGSEFGWVLQVHLCPVRLAQDRHTGSRTAQSDPFCDHYVLVREECTSRELDHLICRTTVDGRLYPRGGFHRSVTVGGRIHSGAYRRPFRTPPAAIIPGFHDVRRSAVRTVSVLLMSSLTATAVEAQST